MSSTRPGATAYSADWRYVSAPRWASPTMAGDRSLVASPHVGISFQVSAGRSDGTSA